MKATRKLLATYRAVILGVHAVNHEGSFKSCERCEEYRELAEDAKNEMRALAQLIAEKYTPVPMPDRVASEKRTTISRL